MKVTKVFIFNSTQSLIILAFHDIFALIFGLKFSYYHFYNWLRNMIDGGQISPEVLALLFLFFGLTIAVLVKKLRSIYSFVPYTPTLFLISVGLGYFSKDMGIIGQSIQTISKIDPRGILLIFLPPLIFQSGFNSDWYIFRKQATQIFILAFPAVLVGASIIMFSIKAIIQYDDSYYTWPEAFMFGSVLSCTDTVAVLALLKQAGAPRKFNSLIEGQSLFNDGTCMILFTISLQLVKGTPPPPLFIIKLFFQLTLGAIALGCIFGFISAQLINKVRHSSILTLNITVVSCYLVYFTAEYIHLGIKISGIMSLVSLGIYMAAFGKTRIAPEASQIVEHFWKIYVFIAQTIIFILGGVLVGIQFLKPQFISILSKGNIQKLFYLYIFMTLARFLSISLFMPKLKTEGYGLKWNQVGALTYGGLRGAVGIAFTLILAANDDLNQKFRMLSLFNTSGCAFLTLMVNAPTCNFVIRKLGLCWKSETKIKFFIKFMVECQRQLKQKLAQMKITKYIENANWEKVMQTSGLPELRQFIKQQQSKTKSKDIISEKEMKAIKENLLSQNMPDQIDPTLMDQARSRFCIILKGIFWSKFQDNQCSTQSLRMLIQCVNIDMDSTNLPLDSWGYLSSHLSNSYFFPICYWLKNKPLIGGYAYSWIYDRVTLLYDVISTYIQSLSQCQDACRNLPYDQYLQQKVIQQSAQNRKLAQYYLDNEIRVSYFQIMKRVQTTKAAQSILFFQKKYLKDSYQYGEINDTFYKQIANLLQQAIERLQKDSNYKQKLSDEQIMKQNQFFNQFSQSELKRLLNKKTEIFLQKDESILKSYEKPKFIFFVMRGEVMEEYKIGKKTIYKRTMTYGQIGGIGGITMNHNKELQYSAIALATACVYCFQITEVNQIIKNKTKALDYLYISSFMLQVKLESQINQKYPIEEEEWNKKKRRCIFKKLYKDQAQDISNCQLIVCYGRVIYNQSQYNKGYFFLRNQNAQVMGPAKLYIIPIRQIQINENKSISNEEEGIKRLSRMHSRISIKSPTKQKYDAVIRRTLYGKY